MNKREAKAYALSLLASRAEHLADPITGDEALSDEENAKVGAALLQLRDELERRADQFDQPPRPRARPSGQRRHPLAEDDDAAADRVMARVEMLQRERAARLAGQGPNE